ncbi:MAG: hypothetical protein H7326_02820 [Bdellovibrionaceae bacterium]|nr:hypothetical protein [Pseudobdellovibrionaceae bacterium]
MMKYVFILSVFVVGGFAAGYFTESVEPFSWSKLEDDAKTNRLPAEDTTPCPTPEEAAQMVTKFKIGFDLAGWSCQKDDTRTFFLKALALAKKFSINLPEKVWDPKFRAAMADLPTWLSRYTSAYLIDTVMADTTIAYYRPDENKTYMTERIKAYTPNEVFGIIVHENRHAEVPLIAHVVCISGDFPRGAGACDEEFSEKMSDMGAYNFASLFEIASVLYNDKLTASEKDVLAISALQTLSNRFNQIPSGFGFFHEVIASLDDRNQLAILNPLTLEAMPIPTNGAVERIDNNSGASLFSIFTKAGVWQKFNLFKGTETPFADVLAGKKIVDANRSRVFSLESIMDVYINGGKLEFLEVDSVTKKKRPSNINMLNGDVVRTDLSRIIFGDESEILFLSNSGKLYRARQYGNEEAYAEIKPGKDRPEGPWIQGTSGPLYNDLYVTNISGDVFNIAIRYKVSDPEDGPEPAYEPPTTQFKVLKQLGSRRVAKYIRGLNAEYALLLGGELEIRPYSEKEFRTVKTRSRIRDFAVIKSFSPTPVSMQARLSRQKKFESLCGVKSSALDPWLKIPMGVDSANNLVMSGLFEERCLHIPNTGPVLGFAVRSQLTESSAEHNHFSRPTLVLETPRGPKVVRPYE